MLELYHHGSSACAAKVRFALEEKRLQWNGHVAWVAGRPIRYVETDGSPIRDALLAAGAPPDTAEHNSKLVTQAFCSGVLGVLNDDVLDVTGRPPLSFGEFAVGAAAAWRR
jgi:hypothetical protein